MALGLTHPLAEISTRVISWGEKQPECRTDNLATFMHRLSTNANRLDILEPSGIALHLLSFNNNWD